NSPIKQCGDRSFNDLINRVDHRCKQNTNIETFARILDGSTSQKKNHSLLSSHYNERGLIVWDAIDTHIDQLLAKKQERMRTIRAANIISKINALSDNKKENASTCVERTQRGSYAIFVKHHLAILLDVNATRDNPLGTGTMAGKFRSVSTVSWKIKEARLNQRGIFRAKLVQSNFELLF
ncbi:hypothetical protein RFI_30263, partial [Reticulomyxa filosa]